MNTKWRHEIFWYFSLYRNYMTKNIFLPAPIRVPKTFIWAVVEVLSLISLQREISLLKNYKNIVPLLFVYFKSLAWIYTQAFCTLKIVEYIIISRNSLGQNTSHKGKNTQRGWGKKKKKWYFYRAWIWTGVFWVFRSWRAVKNTNQTTTKEQSPWIS